MLSEQGGVFRRLVLNVRCQQVLTPLGPEQTTGLLVVLIIL